MGFIFWKLAFLETNRPLNPLITFFKASCVSTVAFDSNIVSSFHPSLTLKSINFVNFRFGHHLTATKARTMRNANQKFLTFPPITSTSWLSLCESCNLQAILWQSFGSARYKHSGNDLKSWMGLGLIWNAEVECKTQRQTNGLWNHWLYFSVLMGFAKPNRTQRDWKIRLCSTLLWLQVTLNEVTGSVPMHC